MNKEFKTINFYKLYIAQIYGYLALVPFYFAYLALRKNCNSTDLIIFSTGLFFLAVLILINHLEPAVKVTEHKIILYNKFHNRALVLLKSDYVSYKAINRRLIIVTFNSGKYNIKLNSKNTKRLINLLEEIN